MTCAAPTCNRPATRGLLCADDHQLLGQNLADIATALTADTGPSLTGWRTGGGHGGVLASERDPINLRQLDAQRQAPPVLEAWAAWLLERRPELTRTGGAVGARTLLAQHFDWLTAQPEVVDFWCQIRALWGSLRGHLPARACACGGPVWVDRGGGWCSWCATPYAGRELLELGRVRAAA